ncbi:hypothetical protein [Emticicia sp. BO119]|uniref:hypothetical protein n=1 Tax=Emticicia sp. BO119 TaxID=2757768 RepID=UPI0015F05860|nr:hypothetical protein [Emticicia sp. BO119]MBA4850412.1 hypothetical protein [Emticicia sp. BO119]
MKTLLCLLLLLSCRLNTDILLNEIVIGDNSTDAKPYVLTAQEAQQILGEPGHIIENSDSLKTGVHEYKSTYLANALDVSTNKTGNVYYIYEDYKSETAAKKTYEGFWTSNKRSQGIEPLTQFGDEAFYHSDGRNFYLIIARKGNKMIRLKVNKVTSKTSAEVLKRVAKEVLGRV